MELAIGLLLKKTNGSADHFWVSGMVSASLYAVESTSALNTLACLKDVLDAVPAIQEFLRDPDVLMRLRHTCTDRHARASAPFTPTLSWCTRSATFIFPQRAKS